MRAFLKGGIHKLLHGQLRRSGASQMTLLLRKPYLVKLFSKTDLEGEGDRNSQK